MSTTTANGAELHYDLRGTGPPLLLVIGAPGDGAFFDELAAELAGDFTVITYDRRGNGRSPRPAGWESTSLDEQADDAAALLDTLGLLPAAVFGTSLGGLIAVRLAERRPDNVSHLVLHEPAFWSLFDDPDEARATIAVLVNTAMAEGGPPLVIERFLRFVACDENWERLDPVLRDRVRSNADTYLHFEQGRFNAYQPDYAALRESAIPVHLIISDNSHAYFAQAATRLAEKLGTGVARTPGTHFAYLDHATELADNLKHVIRDRNG